MRRIGFLACWLAATACAMPSPASAAERVLIIKGGGFGHGVGMSQYGARGFALRGASYEAILRHYYTGTQLGVLSRARSVRVLLQAGAPVATFRGATLVGDRRTDPHVAYQLVARGADLELRNAAGRKLALFTAPLTAIGPGPLKLGGAATNGVTDGRYRGLLEFRPQGGRVTTVNQVDLDDYVASVVGAEMSASWPIEALKAQAVAARTYAITTGRGGEVFDQYPDTRSQVYGGLTGEAPSTIAATRATHRRVVVYEGKPVTTFFFSTSGGRTEDSRFVFGQPRPWLRSVDDPYDTGSPKHRWTIRMAPEAAASRLSGLVKGGFLGIRVIRRGASPRVITAQVVGTHGDTTVSGATLQARLGLPDTWAYFAVVG
jgi:stage II sporulation protein D